MKKISILMGLIGILAVVTACKSKVPDIAPSESSISEEHNDYFLPESSSISLEEDIGSATIEIKTNEFKDDIPVFNIDIENLTSASIDVETSGFDMDKKIFVYIDSALILVKEVSQNIEIPFNLLVTSAVEGNHTLSFIQYEKDDEESTIYNQVNRAYMVVHQ